MDIYKNKLFLACIMPVLASILVSGLYSDSVFAHTATLTTANSISLDALPQHDGVAIDEESIEVETTCRAGYNLSIATSTSSDLYLNGDGTGTATFTAVDGTSTLVNSTNKWGYSMTANASSSTVFSPLSTTASVLKTPSQTASQTDIDDTFSIYFGTKVADSVTPGSYQMADSGAIVYYLTMDATCTEYIVSFNANGGTGVVANQGIQEGIATKLTSADTLTAPTGASYTDADNNTITGDADKLWTFWGWNTQADGTGDWYKDKEAVEDLTNVGSTITLYAQWKQATLADLTTSTPVGTEKTIDHNEMQDMSPAACYNSPITTAANAPAATLLDYRGKVTTGENPEQPEQYTISKLADGLCWMTTNLNLGRTGTDGPNGDGTVILTSDDTDLATSTTFTLPAADTTSYTATTRLAKVRLTNNDGTTANGAYYTWSAAVANTNSISTSPTTSICPRSWDLPSDTMYTNLKAKADYKSGNLTTAQPSNFLINGGFTNGAAFNGTSYSHFWTNRSSSNTVAYGARVNGTTMTVSSSTGTTYGGNKYYRKNIRCIASNGKATINYDGNGTTEYPVTGTTASQTNVEINSTNTSANGFTRTGWVFNGWNTEANGTGTAITAANASTTSLVTLGLKPGETITLYAQWIPQYTITYTNNCMTYASANSACTQTVSDGTSEQKINLVNNPSTGTETDTLAAYNKWTLTGWKIAGWTTNADGTGTEYKVSSTYTVPSGSSVGSGITLYAHWVPIYSIQYDGNNADNPNGMGTTEQSTGVKSVKQTNVGEGDSVVLLASNFKRAGYGFAGWSTSSTATIGGTDKIYGPMETIEAPAYPNNGTNIITMYAVWVAAEKDGSNNPVYLQNFTTSDCNALTSADFNSTTGVITPGSVIALTDKRDNEVYTIAKLADDNCWMVENLRLEHAGTVGNNTNDSSVTNQSLSQGYGGTTGTYGNFVGLADSESANFTDSTTSNTVYKSSAASPTDTYDPANNILEDIGTTSSPGYRFPRYNNSNNSSALSSPTYTESYANASSSSTSGTYKTSTVSSYGNYYTWAAAMANTTYYTGTSGSESAGTSICPTNWTLPTSGTTTKNFGTLSRSYDGSGENQSSSVMSNRFRSFPNNFLYSGYISGSSVLSRGSDGYYWSRSDYGRLNGSYDLRLNSTNLNPSSNSSKSIGFSVRCLIGS